MPTLPADFYACRGFEERRQWLTEANRRRCIEAEARKAAEGPKAEAEEEWDLDPSRVADRHGR